MVSKSNYAVILGVMLVVLFLFQFTGISQDVVLRSGENPALGEALTVQEETAAQESFEQETEALASGKAGAGNAEIRGDAGFAGGGEALLRTVESWCEAQKRALTQYESLAEAAADPDGPALLVADGAALAQEAEQEALAELGEQGRSVIVSTLPPAEALSSSRTLRESLGVREVVRESLDLDGFALYEGLLLGGGETFDELPLTVPYVRLGAACKVYAVGVLEEEWFEALENEELPPILWRAGNGGGLTAVVNGEFLEAETGTGLLTGLAADLTNLSVYPVVNARVSAAENYPLLAEENEEQMTELYGQGSVNLFRDTIWPGLAGIFYDTGESLTALCAPRLDYTRPLNRDEDLAEFYYQQILKLQGEIGLSGMQVSDVPLEEKLSQDLDYLHSVLPEYEIGVFYAGSLAGSEYEGLLGGVLEDVRTVLADGFGEDGRLFSYLENGAIRLSVYLDGTVHEEEDDFLLRCMQTGYAYCGTGVDLSRVVFPESEDDLWNNMSLEWARLYRPYRSRYAYFDALTASQAGRRVREYLAVSYDGARAGDTLTLTAGGGETMYFMLRTHGEEVVSMTGGTFEELEQDWTLLTVTEGTAAVTLRQRDRSEYAGKE